MPDGQIRWSETGLIFSSPSSWAMHCKKLVNPTKKSGCGWASVSSDLLTFFSIHLMLLECCYKNSTKSELINMIGMLNQQISIHNHFIYNLEVFLEFGIKIKWPDALIETNYECVCFYTDISLFLRLS